MANITVTVTGQAFQYETMPVIASHGVNENYVCFTFDEAWDGYAKKATFYHEFTPNEIYVSVVDGDDKAVMPHEVYEKPGKVYIGVTGVSGNVKLTSKVMPYPILPGSNDDGANSEEPTPSIADQLMELVRAVEGSPLVADTAEGMTNINKIYVYTGSETGYVNGNWYYYDGSSWQSGGVYNSQAIGLAYQQEVAQMVKQSAVASESDSTPYLYRPTPNPSAILADEEIVGGTIAFNQLCNSASVTVPSGHKYYLLKAGASTITASTGAAVTGLDDGTDMVIDLTAMLGSTIADYLNTIESGTAGAGVAKLKEWGFLSKDYYAYDAGSLVSVNTEGKEVVGKNLYCYDATKATTGTTTDNTIRAYYPLGLKNCTLSFSAYNIPGAGSTSVYINVAKLSGGLLTSLNSLILNDGTTYNRTYTFSENEEAVLLAVSNSTTGIISNLPKYDIQVEYGSAVTSYEPYRATTYPTTPTDLNGIFKLDSNNNLYADGDRYKSDGTITRIYHVDVIDGGANLTVASVPQHSSGYYYCAIGISSAYTAANNTNLFNDGGYSAASGVVPGHIYEASGGSMIVVVLFDQTITTAAAANTYFASHPLHIVYELASAKQTTDTADTYPATQIAPKGGTERRIDNRAVPVPVGHRTTYSIGVPDVPSNASALSLKATVTNGKTTLSWS